MFFPIDLCPFLTHSLDFDGLYAMWEVKEGKKGLNFERKKILQWVNHTLKSYRVLTIDEFRVCFNLMMFLSERLDTAKSLNILHLAFMLRGTHGYSS